MAKTMSKNPAAPSPATAKEPASDESDFRIVVLQRGWVAVGDFTREGSDCRLENASVIRRWGTTKGLGELAASGPTKTTVLDPAGTLRFHELTIVATFDAEKSKWSAAS